MHWLTYAMVMGTQKETSDKSHDTFDNPVLCQLTIDIFQFSHKINIMDWFCNKQSYRYIWEK